MLFDKRMFFVEAKRAELKSADYGHSIHGKKLWLVQGLLKTGCNNVVLPILFIVVNNIVQHCYTWSRADSGSTMLNNIVDNYEQYGQHNIVASCFQ